jgi:hypothetical protein
LDRGGLVYAWNHGYHKSAAIHGAAFYSLAHPMS